METASTRTGAVLLAVGTLPFVAGRLLYHDPTATGAGGAGGFHIPCPFRALTGLPCPLCGATRGVALFAHGDGAFTQLNLVVVLALVAVALAGAAVLLAPAARRPVARVLASPGLALLAVGVVAWAWTLAHRATIT